MTWPLPAERGRWGIILGATMAACALPLVAGFVWFVHAAAMPAAMPEHADGIVVLTGGAERVETALRLLADGKADRMLISGVGGAAEFSELAHRAKVNPALGARVTLGRSALSTRGNANETADWAHAQRIGTLIVVTASYHMPRALAELSRTLPEITLYPVPVQSAGLREAGRLAYLRLLAGEFGKWVAAEAGLTSLASRHDDRNGGRGPSESASSEHGT